MDIASLPATLRALCIIGDDTIGNNIPNHIAALPEVLSNSYQNTGMNGGADVTWFPDFLESFYNTTYQNHTLDTIHNPRYALDLNALLHSDGTWDPTATFSTLPSLSTLPQNSR